MASDKGSWRGEKKWKFVLGLHHEKPLRCTWEFRFGCKVMCIRYLAHNTRCIVSAQYIWAAIIIVQGLQRSCGWASVDGLLGNQFSVLSSLYTDSRWLFFKRVGPYWIQPTFRWPLTHLHPTLLTSLRGMHDQSENSFRQRPCPLSYLCSWGFAHVGYSRSDCWINFSPHWVQILPDKWINWQLSLCIRRMAYSFSGWLCHPRTY